MYSLRRTLAVRLSLTIFLALLLIAFWASMGAQHILRDELDRGLAAAAQLESAVLATGLPLPGHHGPPEEATFVLEVNRFVAVRDTAGGILQGNTVLALDLPLDRRSFERARAGHDVWITQPWRGDKVRSLYHPVPAGSGPNRAVVQVAASLKPLADDRRRMMVLMLGTVVLGTVATAMGAGWLAGSAVTPVHEITQQADAITAGTTGQRITAHADVEEYHGLITVLNRMLDRLDRALAAERRIIADVGHDLRTPITAMRGQIEIALRGAREREQYRDVLRSVLEEVDRLNSISEALVLLARIEAGELRPERRPADLVDLLEQAAGRARSRAGNRVIRVAADGEVRVAVDEGMIRTVVDHLLDNAVRHTPAGTTIDVAARADGSTVALSVDDDGAGISPEALPHLFQRFYRCDEARTRTAGAGLGLSIAAAIAAAHGGTIAADHSDRGGLRITLHLPRLT